MLFPRIPTLAAELNRNIYLLTGYASVICFLTYSCMYAFRKPFTAATFGSVDGFVVSYKVLLVMAQLIGYTLSKFLGIKLIAELKSYYRAAGIIGLIGWAWGALVLFAFVPPAWGVVCLFFNGLPLGFIWGLVFSYIEGRRTTELMGAVLTVSFIFSSGFVKSVGKWLMVHAGVSEMAMPYVTGAIFFLPMVIFVFLLEQIPPPDSLDQSMRTERIPMTKEQRIQFLKTFLPGIAVLVVTYVILSILRDFRDNFAADIWKEVGFEKVPSVFTTTEIPASVIILILMSLLVFVKDNFRALQINHYMVIAGFVIALLATLAFHLRYISPVAWMALNGIGLYMGYVPFNCMLFERMIAVFKKPANVGFLMYISDSFGYLGSVGVLLYKEFSSHEVSWVNFFSFMLLGVCVVGMVFTVFSQIYFHRKKTTQLK